MHTIFLVEDEIITREGIRNSVPWDEIGIYYAGDAPDGEVALPQILEIQPDILITDIRMPFMDGLELARILRKQMPGLKIIILSGHDEFEYAQQAIPLEVSNYLLKPVTRDELTQALKQVVDQLNFERHQEEHHLELLEKSNAYQGLLQEKLMFRLITGGIEISDALSQSERLEIDIIAQRYLVMSVTFEPTCNPLFIDYKKYQALKQAAISVVQCNPDVLWFYKDIDELVLIIKGKSSSPLEYEAGFLANLVTDELPSDSDCRVHIGVGSVCERLTELPGSYGVARQQRRRRWENKPIGSNNGMQLPDEFSILKRETIEHFLNLEALGDFEAFFETAIAPLRQTVESSAVYRNYVFTHIAFTCAHFIKQMGGNAFHVLPMLDRLEQYLMDIETFDQLKSQIMLIIEQTLAFRDRHVNALHHSLIWEAKAFIKDNFQNPDIALQDVADHVKISPSHFSRIFSRDAGVTFIEYLTRIRIERAEELLRTTNLRAYQVAEQVGYNDPHYFSTVFKRVTGVSPSDYQTQRTSERTGGR